MRIATCNFFVGNKQPERDAKKLASYNVDVAGIQEGHSGNVGAIKRTINDKYRTIVGGVAIEKQDSAVVINRKHHILKWWVRQISKRSQAENIGMPRTATAVRFKSEKKVWTVINTHTNAAVQNRTTGEPLPLRIRRVAEFVAGMIILEAMIRKAKKDSNYVVLTGDLNYRVRQAGKPVWKFSPEDLFRRTKMDFFNQGLDYIAWSRNLEKKGPANVIDASEHGGDHPWIIVDLVPKKS